MALIEEWQGYIATLSDENLAGLAREAELGQAMNFAPAIPKLRAIREILEAVARQPEDQLPSTLPVDADNMLRPLNELVAQMRAFDPTQASAGPNRQSYLAQIDTVHRQVCQSLRPQIRAADLDASGKAAEMDALIADARNNAKAVEDILSTLRTGAGKVGAEKTSEYYAEQAKEHKDSAQLSFWLSVAIGIVIAALVYVFFVYIQLPLDSSAASGTQWADFARNVVQRLFVLAVPSYFLSLTLRNYRVNKHLQVVNETRRNALNTYPLFVSAASTDEARGVITAELARSVFGNVETGYIHPGSERTLIEQAPLVNLVSRPPGPPG